VFKESIEDDDDSFLLIYIIITFCSLYRLDATGRNRSHHESRRSYGKDSGEAEREATRRLCERPHCSQV
jgi:hypothetical protein